jgi:hypothetical protein
MTTTNFPTLVTLLRARLTPKGKEVFDIRALDSFSREVFAVHISFLLLFFPRVITQPNYDAVIPQSA